MTIRGSSGELGAMAHNNNVLGSASRGPLRLGWASVWPMDQLVRCAVTARAGTGAHTTQRQRRDTAFERVSARALPHVRPESSLLRGTVGRESTTTVAGMPDWVARAGCDETMTTPPHQWNVYLAGEVHSDWRK